MNKLTIFNYEGNTVRTVMKDGNPWWVLKDVCSVLEIGNSRDVMARLDSDEKGVDIIDTPGGKQEVSIINESGLYSVILVSRKPEAKKFKRWVTHEVLPSIRRHGLWRQNWNRHKRNLFLSNRLPADWCVSATCFQQKNQPQTSSG